MSHKIKNIFRFALVFACFGCGLLTLDDPEPRVRDDSSPVTEPEQAPANPNPVNDQDEDDGNGEVDSADQEQPEAINTPIPPKTEPPADVSGFEIGPVVTPTYFPAAYTDTSLQLETFDVFWNAVNDEYLYRDFNGVDWDGVYDEYRPQVKAGMSNPDFWNMLTNLVYQLDDEHSYFVPTDNAEGIRDLMRSGVGYSGVGVALIGRPDQQDALVGWSIPGNGAHNAGIRSGDRILAVDGHPICCHPNGEPFGFLLGADGSSAEVIYQTPGQPVEAVQVQRAPIELNDTISGKMLDGNIGYIQINTFLARGVREEFETIWTEMNTPNRVDGLIIDLRANTGGFVFTADLIMYKFITGTLHYNFDAYEKDDGRLLPMNFSGDDLLGSQTVPLVILVSEATNSRGEVFAGILRDTGRAELVGRPTNGNIETISLFDLPDGSFVYLATDSLIPLSEDDWEENGLTIDHFIEQRFGEIEADGRDDALEKALDILRN